MWTPQRSTPPALAEMMRTYKGRTSTSCPNISDWLTAYEGADEVYVVTITGTLSGAYNAALLAGEEYEQSHEGARVFVLDSLSTGAESRLLVERLAALIKAGKPFDTVCKEIRAYHEHTHLLFALESLANLARNGRVKPLWLLWRGCWASGSSGRPAMPVIWRFFARPAASTAHWSAWCWK